MSQVRRPKSEFLGLHDPYADMPASPSARPSRRLDPPILDKEKGEELIRAGASLLVIVVLIGVAVTALY